MKRIFLTGMMGAGKSYWAKIWAKTSGYVFLDMDEQIALRAGKSIRRIFEEDGEAAFRMLEHQLLREITSTAKAETIVACGGGTPFYHHNMALMKAAGCVVYLQADVAYLLANLQRETAHRPKLDGDVEARLRALLAERAAGYEQADQILQAGKLTAATFAEIIAACTNRRS